MLVIMTFAGRCKGALGADAGVGQGACGMGRRRRGQSPGSDGQREAFPSKRRSDMLPTETHPIAMLSAKPRD